MPSVSLKPLSLEYENDVYQGIRTAVETKEDNLRHECVCKV